MVPVEMTAFGFLAASVILLGAVMLVYLVFPRDAAILARFLLVPTLVVVVVLAIYVKVITRARYSPSGDPSYSVVTLELIRQLLAVVAETARGRGVEQRAVIGGQRDADVELAHPVGVLDEPVAAARPPRSRGPSNVPPVMHTIRRWPSDVGSHEGSRG